MCGPSETPQLMSSPAWIAPVLETRTHRPLRIYCSDLFLVVSPSGLSGGGRNSYPPRGGGRDAPSTPGEGGGTAEPARSDTVPAVADAGGEDEDLQGCPGEAPPGVGAQAPDTAACEGTAPWNGRVWQAYHEFLPPPSSCACLAVFVSLPLLSYSVIFNIFFLFFFGFLYFFLAPLLYFQYILIFRFL